MSARFGVNVMTRSGQTPWYKGPPLLSHLESVDVDTASADKPFRMAVQWGEPSNLDFRGFSGTIAGGRSGRRRGGGGQIRTRFESHTHRHHGRRPAPEAVAGDAVTLTLADEVDISRGDVLAAPEARPDVSDQFAAHLLWMADEEMLPDGNICSSSAPPPCPPRCLSLSTRSTSTHWTAMPPRHWR